MVERTPTAFSQRTPADTVATRDEAGAPLSSVVLRRTLPAVSPWVLHWAMLPAPAGTASRSWKRLRVAAAPMLVSQASGSLRPIAQLERTGALIAAKHGRGLALNARFQDESPPDVEDDAIQFEFVAAEPVIAPSVALPALGSDKAISLPEQASEQSSALRDDEWMAANLGDAASLVNSEFTAPPVRLGRALPLRRGARAQASSAAAAQQPPARRLPSYGAPVAGRSAPQQTSVRAPVAASPPTVVGALQTSTLPGAEIAPSPMASERTLVPSPNPAPQGPTTLGVSPPSPSQPPVESNPTPSAPTWDITKSKVAAIEERIRRAKEEREAGKPPSVVLPAAASAVQELERRVNEAFSRVTGSPPAPRRLPASVDASGRPRLPQLNRWRAFSRVEVISSAAHLGEGDELPTVSDSPTRSEAVLQPASKAQPIIAAQAEPQPTAPPQAEALTSHPIIAQGRAMLPDSAREASVGQQTPVATAPGAEYTQSPLPSGPDTATIQSASPAAAQSQASAPVEPEGMTDAVTSLSTTAAAAIEPVAAFVAAPNAPSADAKSAVVPSPGEQQGMTPRPNESANTSPVQLQPDEPGEAKAPTKSRRPRTAASVSRPPAAGAQAATSPAQAAPHSRARVRAEKPAASAAETGAGASSDSATAAGHSPDAPAMADAQLALPPAVNSSDTPAEHTSLLSPTALSAEAAAMSEEVYTAGKSAPSIDIGNADQQLFQERVGDGPVVLASSQITTLGHPPSLADAGPLSDPLHTGREEDEAQEFGMQVDRLNFRANDFGAAGVDSLPEAASAIAAVSPAPTQPEQPPQTSSTITRGPLAPTEDPLPRGQTLPSPELAPPRKDATSGEAPLTSLANSPTSPADSQPALAPLSSASPVDVQQRSARQEVGRSLPGSAVESNNRRLTSAAASSPAGQEPVLPARPDRLAAVSSQPEGVAPLRPVASSTPRAAPAETLAQPIARQEDRPRALERPDADNLSAGLESIRATDPTPPIFAQSALDSPSVSPVRNADLSPVEPKPSISLSPEEAGDRSPKPSISTAPGRAAVQHSHHGSFVDTPPSVDLPRSAPPAVAGPASSHRSREADQAFRPSPQSSSAEVFNAQPLSQSQTQQSPVDEQWNDAPKKPSRRQSVSSSGVHGPYRSDLIPPSEEAEGQPAARLVEHPFVEEQQAQSTGGVSTPALGQSVGERGSSEPTAAETKPLPADDNYRSTSVVRSETGAAPVEPAAGWLQKTGSAFAQTALAAGAAPTTQSGEQQVDVESRTMRSSAQADAVSAVARQEAGQTASVRKEVVSSQQATANRATVAAQADGSPASANEKPSPVDEGFRSSSPAQHVGAHPPQAALAPADVQAATEQLAHPARSPSTGAEGRAHQEQGARLPAQATPNQPASLDRESGVTMRPVAEQVAPVAPERQGGAGGSASSLVARGAPEQESTEPAANARQAAEGANVSVKATDGQLVLPAESAPPGSAQAPTLDSTSRQSLAPAIPSIRAPAALATAPRESAGLMQAEMPSPGHVAGVGDRIPSEDRQAQFDVVFETPTEKQAREGDVPTLGGEVNADDGPVQPVSRSASGAGRSVTRPAGRPFRSQSRSSVPMPLAVPGSSVARAPVSAKPSASGASLRGAPAVDGGAASPAISIGAASGGGVGVIQRTPAEEDEERRDELRPLGRVDSISGEEPPTAGVFSAGRPAILGAASSGGGRAGRTSSGAGGAARKEARTQRSGALPLARQTIQHSSEPTTAASAPHISRLPAAAFVQREQTTSTATEVMVTSGAPEESSEVEKKQDREKLLNDLARQIYPLIKRLIALERERRPWG